MPSVPTHPAPRGVFSPHPTEASSDHLLVFPGTFPSPGICPTPALHVLAPRFCQPAHGVVGWPGLGSSVAAVGRGGRCRLVPGLLGSLAGWARVGWGRGAPGVCGRGEDLLAPLPGVSAAASKLGCVPLPGCVHGGCVHGCCVLGHLVCGCSASSALA